MNRINPLILLVHFLSFIPLCAQFGGQQIISTNAEGCQQVFVGDLNGDLFPDVVSANKFLSSITWYENMEGNLFSSDFIVGEVNQPPYVTAADLDGDDDLDIIATNYADDKIIWFKNDGLGNFEDGQIIGSESDAAFGLFVADIDEDNDLDVICAADFSGLAWYENLDGLGNFSSAHIIDDQSSNNRTVMAVDIDGDNHLDIVAGSSGTYTLSWYRNINGTGMFESRQVIAGSGSTIVYVFCADLDGDQDSDIITATPGDDKVAWFENLDGQGTFGDEQIITLDADFVRSVTAADIDNDQDLDILSASSSDNKIAWYENINGEGEFSSQNIISTEMNGAFDVKVGDIDLDGDLDVISGSQNDDKVAWYENLTILNVDSNIANKVSIVPNPVEDSFRVQSDYPVSNVRVMNASGMLLLEVKENFEQIPIKNLQTGMYLVEVVIEHHKVVKKLVKQ